MAPVEDGPSDRESLKRRLFELWDKDGDEALKMPELLQLARATGFDGTDEEWSEEYPNMCNDQGCQPEAGLSKAAVMALLDDDSDVGCYFTDQELLEILTEAQASGAPSGVVAPASPGDAASPVAPASPGTAVSPVAPASPGNAVSPVAPASPGNAVSNTAPASPGNAVSNTAPASPANAVSSAAPPSPAAAAEAASSARLALKRRLFRIWDTDGDGFLCRGELLALARATGFDGNEEEWAAEYPQMCGEKGCDPERGLPETVVMALLDDDSDDGCHFSDEELRQILVEAGAGEADGDVVMGGSEEHGRSSSSSSSDARAKATAAAIDREVMKRRLFRAWDADRDGFLKKDEMLQLALVTGFDGTDEDWATEYAAMCEEHKFKPLIGFPKTAVLALLDDETDQGAFLPTDEIQRMIEVMLAGTPDPEAEIEFKVKVVRAEDGRAGFNVRQADLVVTGIGKNEALSPMKNGDVIIAVDGKAVSTFAEYTSLAHGVKEFVVTGKKPKAFQDADRWEGAKPGYHFKKGEHGLGYYRDVVNGVFTVMRGFQEFFPASRFQGEWVGHVFKKGHCGLGYYVDTQSRVYFKKRLFELWDTDKDGRLNQTEALQFAQDTGFEGSWAEWVEEFGRMCQGRHCDPAAGLSESAVCDMLEDQTDHGCYIASDDLKLMIDRITKAFATSKERADLAERAGAVQKLEDIPVSRLKALAKLHSVSLTGCLERSEIVDTLKKAGISDQGAAAVAKAAEKQLDEGGEEAQVRGSFDKKVHLCDDAGELKRPDVVKMAACVGWLGNEDDWVKLFSDVFNNQGLRNKKEVTIAQAMACAEVAKARLLDGEKGSSDIGEPAKKKPKLCLPKGMAGVKAPTVVGFVKPSGLLTKKCDACETEVKSDATVFCINCKAFLCQKCDEENHTTNLLKKHTRHPINGKAAPAGPPEKVAKEFPAMSISELKALAKLKVVDLSSCVEKADIISALEKAGVKPQDAIPPPDKEKEKAAAAAKVKAAPKKVQPPPKKEEKVGDIRPPTKNPKQVEEEKLQETYIEHRDKLAPGSQWELQTGVALWRNDTGWERTFYINALNNWGQSNVIEVVEYGERRVKVRGMGLDRATGTLVGQRWQMGWLELAMIISKDSGELLVTPNTRTGLITTPRPKAKMGTGVKVLPKAMAKAGTEAAGETKDPEAGGAKPEGLQKEAVKPSDM